ncbi:MAG: hypothetical protein EOO92_05040 [Pedobacter sp.]|nr:MAG: hypothetical protein EOO92_05040 [Pedobacter sp.]
MLKINPESELKIAATDISSVYDRYAGMLLGFISQIIKNKEQAEEKMITIFSELGKAVYVNHSARAEDIRINSWNDLRVFALNFLPAQNSSTLPTASPVNGKLTELQQQVFNIAYYQKRSINEIAAQLNQTEDSIRKALREAFAVMKGNREN